MLTIIFVVFIGLLILDLPVAFAIACVSFIYIISEQIPITVVAQRTILGADSYSLLAIPLYLLAGMLMNKGGITDRITEFSLSLVGRIPGGMGHMNIVNSMIFAGMSGSAVADASGIGQVELKMMKDAGYDAPFSAVITAASSTIGPIIPPSIPFVIYGSLAGVSVGRLFLGGVIPGVLMALLLMVAVYFTALKRGYPTVSGISLKRLIVSFFKALPALITPAIIIGGLMIGIFTPTEAGAIASVYAMFLGFLYREITRRNLISVLRYAVENTAAIMLITAMANVLAWILAREQVGPKLVSMIFSVTTNRYVILALINLLILVLGALLNPTALLIILVPILAPMTKMIGIDPVQFGVMIVLGLMIGLITPPVGQCMYIVCSIAGIKMVGFAKELLPSLVALIAVLFLVTYWPPLTTWLSSVQMP
jgi:tripartite ATP-independent transporter DctM subunit